MLLKFVKSQVRVIRTEAEKEGIDMKNVTVGEGEKYSTHTLSTLWLTKRMDPKIATELRDAIKHVRQWISLKLVDDSLAGKLLYYFLYEI